MMGLPGYVHWLAWFITVLFSCLVTVGLIIFLLCLDFKVGPVFEFTAPEILFVTYLLYSMSLILMMFAVSSFINNGKL